MWGNRNTVELRKLSAYAIINDRVRFSVGDLFLKQSNFTLFNYDQEFSEFEPSVFNFYREYINYENHYYKNFWRLQGAQTNFSYNMFNLLERIDLDAFIARVRGSQWLGDPELLMSAGTILIKFNNKFRFRSNYINTFEIISSSNGEVAYFNPVFTSKFNYFDNINNIPLNISLETGFSKRGWRGDDIAPEINGTFISALVKSKINEIDLSFSFRYVDTDFRSLGAQSRRVDYTQIPTSYPYYNNDYVKRKISILDIISDPFIYSQKLSTSLVQFNPMYSNISPYGDATPNRLGGIFKLSDFTLFNFLEFSFSSMYFNEITGQGTTEKRNFYAGNLYSTMNIHKALNLSRTIKIETSLNSEVVSRGGESFEKINLTTNLLSGGLTIGLLDNLNIISGAKVFYANGNEVIAERNRYDEVIDYSVQKFNNKETILISGLQYFFNRDMYLTMQYNYFNIVEKNNLQDEFSLGRFIFMFNMNL